MAVSQTQLIELYLAYFGRPADTGGLQFYSANSANTIGSVATAFSVSAESQALYGPTFGAAQINAIYQNLFNRDAEPAGQVYWAAEVASGRISSANAALAILQGAQNQDRISVQNKVAVSTAFTAQLDTQAEVSGYAGATAAAAARAFLDTVDATAASVTAANIVLAAQVAIAVGVPVTPPGGTGGSTFTLNVIGAESITATAGDDTVNGTYTDGGVGTFNATDVISGGTNGAGGDTLNIHTLGAVAITPPDAMWAQVNGFEKLAFITDGGAGAQTITTGTAFNAAFGAGVNLVASNGAGAITIDMASFTGAASITSTSSGAGKHDITTGTGAAIVNSTTLAGDQVIKGVNLGTVLATSNGAGNQTIGDAIGGGAALVAVTAIQNQAGNLMLTSTSANAVTVTATHNGTAGNQNITTGAGADIITATTWGGTNVYSLNAGNDTLTLLGSGTASGNTITGGLGADNITLKVDAAPDILVLGNADSGLTLATADRIVNFSGANDTLKMGTAAVVGGAAATYVEAGAAVAGFAAALAAANTALATLAAGSSATELFAFQFDSANGYLFNDTDGNGSADQVVVLVGVTDTFLAAANIVA